jgi:hypothetical protein
MTLKSKDPAAISSAKSSNKKTKRESKKSGNIQNKNIKDNSTCYEIKKPRRQSIHTFNYTSPNISRRILQKNADFSTNYFCVFPRNNRLLPIRFIYPQPEGMPRKIRNLNDIKQLNEDEVKIFLRGYGEKIDGDIDALKRTLAMSLGVPLDIANETFNLVCPPVLYAKSEEELIEKLGRDKDDIGPLYDFNYTDPDIHDRIRQKRSVFSNNYFCVFPRNHRLLPIRFIYPQPEGMPRKIRNLNDIKQLNADEVKIFLRGYGEETNGDIYDLKRKLAMSVGVPLAIAYDTFKENYPLISNNHSDDSDDSENNSDASVIILD